MFDKISTKIKSFKYTSISVLQIVSLQLYKLIEKYYYK